MIRIYEGYPGEGMSYVALESILGRFKSLMQILEILPCRLSPAQAQTVLNEMLGKSKSPTEGTQQKKKGVSFLKLTP